MEKVRLQIKKKSGTEDIAMPRYMSEAASGMDLCASNDDAIVLEAGKIKLVPTGLSISLPIGFEAQVRPRSGLALRHGIFVVNSPGTIDSDYRGEVGVILGNFGEENFEIKRGMRIAQMVIQKVIHAQIEEVEELDQTTRSSGGFGHTGV